MSRKTEWGIEGSGPQPERKETLDCVAEQAASGVILLIRLNPQRCISGPRRINCKGYIERFDDKAHY